MRYRAHIALACDSPVLRGAIATALLITINLPTTANALDARALGLGGSAIAKGEGVHGVLDNPATLMRQQRDGEGTQMQLGIGIEVRDHGGIIDTLSDDDNEDLADTIGNEVDKIDGAAVQCTPGVDTDDTVCIEGTAELGSQSGRILDILEDVDGERIEARITSDFGVGVTSTPMPYAVHLHMAATGAGRPTVAGGDLDYAGSFESLLSDNDVTVGDIDDSPYLDVDPVDAINPLAPTLSVAQPEETLESEVRGSAMARVQIGMSLARSLTLGGQAVDIGITPKLSALRASSIDTSIADQFDDDSDSFADQFEDSETSKTSLTVDLGASTIIEGTPLRVAGVVRNLIPESIKTEAGFEFETTPQLILGAAYSLDQYSFNADLAVNSAKVDNLETQALALGVEYATALFQLRGGIAHDAGRDEDATALSLGFGIGPLQVGARVAGQDAAQASMQLAYEF